MALARRPAGKSVDILVNNAGNAGTSNYTMSMFHGSLARFDEWEAQLAASSGSNRSVRNLVVTRLCEPCWLATD